LSSPATRWRSHRRSTSCTVRTAPPTAWRAAPCTCASSTRSSGSCPTTTASWATCSRHTHRCASGSHGSKRWVTSSSSGKASSRRSPRIRRRSRSCSSATALLDSRLVLRRNLIAGPLAVPEHVHDPPPLSIPQQLDRVDAAGERLGFVVAVALVRAEGVRDVAVTYRTPGDFHLAESDGAKHRVGPFPVLTGRHDTGAARARGRAAGRNEARLRVEQCLRSFP